MAVTSSAQTLKSNKPEQFLQAITSFWEDILSGSSKKNVLAEMLSQNINLVEFSNYPIFSKRPVGEGISNYLFVSLTGWNSPMELIQVEDSVRPGIASLNEHAYTVRREATVNVELHSSSYGMVLYFAEAILVLYELIAMSNNERWYSLTDDHNSKTDMTIAFNIPESIDPEITEHEDDESSSPDHSITYDQNFTVNFKRAWMQPSDMVERTEELTKEEMNQSFRDVRLSSDPDKNLLLASFNKFVKDINKEDSLVFDTKGFNISYFVSSDTKILLVEEEEGSLKLKYIGYGDATLKIHQQGLSHPVLIEFIVV